MDEPIDMYYSRFGLILLYKCGSVYVKTRAKDYKTENSQFLAEF